jgi:hypothetical protein
LLPFLREEKGNLGETAENVASPLYGEGERLEKIMNGGINI